jgi:hypothetical protein
MAMGDLIGLGRPAWHAVVGLLLLVALTVTAPLPPVEAASKAVDPREIALTPSDLPAGFAVDPGTTGLSPLPDSVGVVYRVDMKRPQTARNVQEGPVVVQQIVVRLDASVTATEMLAVVRDEIVRDAGLAPTDDGPNDGGTVSLKKQDGDVTLYSIGFAKDQMVIFTTTGGLSSVTTFPKLVELAGISSSRLDAALAR